MVDGGLREDAVTQVEDMAGTGSGLREDSAGLAFDFRHGCEQDDRVEIALNGDVVAEPLPGPVELDPPVQADDRAAGVALELQERDGAGAEMDHRAPTDRALAKSLAMCGWTNRAIIVRAERADPAIEDLECLRAGRRLGVQVERRRVRPADPGARSRPRGRDT